MRSEYWYLMHHQARGCPGSAAQSSESGQGGRLEQFEGMPERMVNVNMSACSCSSGSNPQSRNPERMGSGHVRRAGDRLQGAGRGRKGEERDTGKGTLPSLLPLRRVARYSTMNTSWLVSATCARGPQANFINVLRLQGELRTLDAHQNHCSTFKPQ